MVTVFYHHDLILIDAKPFFHVYFNCFCNNMLLIRIIIPVIMLNHP